MSDNDKSIEVATTTSIVAMNEMFNEVLGGRSCEEITALTKMDLTVDPSDLQGLGNEALYVTEVLSGHYSFDNIRNNLASSLKKTVRCSDGVNRPVCEGKYSNGIRESDTSSTEVSVPSSDQKSTNRTADTFKSCQGVTLQSSDNRVGCVRLSTEELSKLSSDEVEHSGSTSAPTSSTIFKVVSEAQKENVVSLQGQTHREEDITYKNYDALSEEEDEAYDQLLAAALKVNNDHRNRKRIQRNNLAERSDYSTSALNDVDLFPSSYLCKKGHSNTRFSFQDLVRCVLGADANIEDPKDTLKALSLVKVVDLSDRGIVDTDDIVCLDSVTHLYLQHNRIETSENLSGLSVLLHLTVLVLSHNNITSIEHFNTIGCNETLMLLDLSYNKIKEFDIENYFSDGLRRSLQDLRLVGNPCAPRYLTKCDGVLVSPITSSGCGDAEEDEDYIKTYRTVILQWCNKLRFLDGVRITNIIRRRLGIETEIVKSHIEDELNNSRYDTLSSEKIDSEDTGQMNFDDADDHISPSKLLLRSSKQDVIAATYEELDAMNPKLSSSSSSSIYIDECDDAVDGDGIKDLDHEKSVTTTKRMKNKKRYSERKNHNSVGNKALSQDTLLLKYLACSSMTYDERSKSPKLKHGLFVKDVIPDEVSSNVNGLYSTEGVSYTPLQSPEYTKRKRRDVLAKELILAHRCRGAQARVLLDEHWEKALIDIRKNQSDAKARKNERRNGAFSLTGVNSSQKGVTTPNDMSRLSDLSLEGHSQAYLQALDALKAEAKCNNLSVLRSNQ